MKNFHYVLLYTLLLVAIAFVGYGVYMIDNPWVSIGVGCFMAWLLVGWMLSSKKGDDS